MAEVKRTASIRPVGPPGWQARVRRVLANPILGFAPWIAFSVLEGPKRYELAIGVALATSVWGDQTSLKVVRDSAQAPAAEPAGVQKELKGGFLSAWPKMPRPEQFNIYKRGEIFSAQAQADARAGRPVSDYYGLLKAMLPFDFSGDLRAIAIPTLMTANQGDDSFGSQPEDAFAMLDRAPRDRCALVQVTAAQGAQLHDQPSGPQVADEYVFDWLDDQLR